MLKHLPRVRTALKRVVLPRPRLTVPGLCVWLLVLLPATLLLVDLDAPLTRTPVTSTVTRVASLSGTRAHGAPIKGTSLALSLRMELAAPPVAGRSRHVSFVSRSLGRTMRYWIYLPPNYRATTQRYPVLYMLHGLGGSEDQWKDMGFFEQADAMIRARQIAPLIIVMPQGDNGYWMNQADGGPRWSDYVTLDVIPHIDQTYRTFPDARHRAIGGLSMGGHGAIQIALNRPGLFSVVGGHSPVFRSATEAFPFFGFGEQYALHDPVSIVQRGSAVPFALWLDMGAEDSWLPRTALLHELLLERGVAHVWRVSEGGHDDRYWQPRIPLYLAWYDQSLRAGGMVLP